MEMSTSLMFDRAISQMGITQDRISKTQTQLSTTKKVVNPSDAPDEAATITRLKSAIDRQNSYIATIDRKSTRLNSSHVSESRMPSSA